jgi:hypothetical protein
VADALHAKRGASGLLELETCRKACSGAQRQQRRLVATTPPGSPRPGRRPPRCRRPSAPHERRSCRGSRHGDTHPFTTLRCRPVRGPNPAAPWAPPRRCTPGDTGRSSPSSGEHERRSGSRRSRSPRSSDARRPGCRSASWANATWASWSSRTSRRPPGRPGLVSDEVEDEVEVAPISSTAV